MKIKKWKVLVAVLGLVGALIAGLQGCGSSSSTTSNNTTFYGAGS